jgi:hypothetical protein
LRIGVGVGVSIHGEEDENPFDSLTELIKANKERIEAMSVTALEMKEGKWMPRKREFKFVFYNGEELLAHPEYACETVRHMPRSFFRAIIKAKIPNRELIAS